MYDLDLDGLRGALERLSQAIVEPSRGTMRWVPPHDQARLVASMKEIVQVLEQSDLSTKRALIGAIPARAVDSRAPELAQTIQRLSGLLSRHYSSTFASDDLRRLHSLLEFPAPDFLDALGRAEDENSHSDVLAYLFDPRSAPGTAPAALTRLAELLPEPAQWKTCFAQAVERDELSVRREVKIGRFWDEDPKALDRVDIVISGRTFVVAIENKVRAREHNRQTDTYWAWLNGMPGLKAGLFLSPEGFRPHSEHFIAMSYRKIAWCFLGETPGRTPEEEVMLSAYFKAVFGQVLRRNAGMILGVENEQRTE